MIFTIGFSEVEGIHTVNPDFDFSNISCKDSWLLVSAMKQREKWERDTPFSPTFELKGIVPTSIQHEQIYNFLYDGGIVISSLVDPDMPIITTAYCNEIPSAANTGIEIKDDDGCTIEYEYYPYNWLIKDLKNLPKQAYDLQTLQEKYTSYQNVEVITSAESIIFTIGDNLGKIIFTSQLNDSAKFKHINEFKNVCNNFVSREVESNVTSR